MGTLHWLLRLASVWGLYLNGPRHPSLLQCPDGTSKRPSVVPTTVTWFVLIAGFSVFISPGSFIFMWKSCMWFLVFF